MKEKESKKNLVKGGEYNKRFDKKYYPIKFRIHAKSETFEKEF